MIALKTRNMEKLLPAGIPKEMGRPGVKIFGRHFLSDNQFAALVKHAEKNAVYVEKKRTEAVTLILKVDRRISALEGPAYSDKCMFASTIVAYSKKVEKVDGLIAKLSACAKEAMLGNDYENPRLHNRKYGEQLQAVNVRLRDLKNYLDQQAIDCQGREMAFA